MLKRAYSILEIRAFDEDKREITGIATTPTPDSYGDIVEPKGAEFNLPIPLLSQHDATKPIGHVTKAKVTKDGIEVTAKLVKPFEGAPQSWADRLNEAWADMKTGLVRGLSIGFKPIEEARIDGTWSFHYLRWRWLELSAVTIPANTDASIQAIKSIDRSVRAALGQENEDGQRLSSLRSTKAAAFAVRIIKPEETAMAKKTYAEQIADLQATREAKAKRMGDITDKTLEDGRTKDAAEREEFDTLKSEIKSLDAEIADLQDLETVAASRAKDVEKDAQRKADRPADEPSRIVSVRSAEKLDKGIAFARFARCKLLSQMDRKPIETVAKHLYPGDERLSLIVKAPVEAANTMDEGWAGNLINEGGIAFADFVEYLRPRTILGQVQDRLRRIPFDTPVLIQATSGSGGWVKEGDSKPVTKWTYARAKLTPLTVAAITAATKQQLMRASADADMLLRDELTRLLGDVLNQTFVDPGIAPVSDESPGSIFNAVLPLPASANPGVFGVRCDIESMLNAHNDANLEFDGLFWLMSGRNAIALSQMTTEIGSLAYPTVNPTGGTLAGFPVFVSNYAPTDSEGGSFVGLVKGSEIYFADEGGVDVAMSDQASLVMDSAPSANSTTPTAAQVVSMFQTNTVAFRAERFINWQRRRAEAVAWMSVNWTSCSPAS